jgi:hypothetical protein
MKATFYDTSDYISLADHERQLKLTHGNDGGSSSLRAGVNTASSVNGSRSEIQTVDVVSACE